MNSTYRIRSGQPADFSYGIRKCTRAKLRRRRSTNQTTEPHFARAVAGDWKLRWCSKWSAPPEPNRIRRQF